MQILITGGSGFIGSNLTASLKKQGNKIIILSRNKSKVSLGISDNIISSLDDIKNDAQINVIFNLAGAPIDKIWTVRYKQILIDSRITVTKEIITLISRLKLKPQLLINASAVGYYGCHKDSVIDEDSKPIDGFTNKLCELWEREALRANHYGVRTCIARLGIVLGKEGGMLQRVIIPFKLGLGGKLGTGRQSFSWIHIKDVINIFEFFIQNKDLRGAYNLTSPGLVTNAEFTKALGSCFNRPTFCSVPTVIIKLIFQEMGEILLLSGSKVFPKRLIQVGYNFKFLKIKNALEDIFC